MTACAAIVAQQWSCATGSVYHRCDRVWHCNHIHLLVAVEEARELYAAAGKPKEIWIVPEAGHRQADRRHPEEYRHRVLAFFDQWLMEDGEWRMEKGE